MTRSNRARLRLAAAACVFLMACGGKGNDTTQETLTVSKQGTGTGTVTSVPSGIDCGTTCSAAYAVGTAVTLAASADGGSTFDGWSGACTGTGTCTVTVSDATEVTAVFRSIRTCETPGGMLTLGEYIVENNTYGNTQAELPAHPITNFTQCASLDAGSTAQTVNAGWTWEWPHQTVPDEVIIRASPAIVYGFKPWLPASTTSNLPLLLGDLGALTIDAAVDQEVGAGQTSWVVVTTWLTSSDVKGEGETVLPIVGSVNIFLNAYGSTGGGPNPVTIDGVDYDMYQYGTTLNYWRRDNQSTPITAIHLDVAKFLADGLSRGTFQSSWWVAEVETSTWLWEGTGALGLTDYQVAVQEGTPPIQETLTVSRQGTGTGTVTSVPAGIDCGSTCSATYTSGTSVTLTASAAEGSTFAGWGGACTGTEACIVTVSDATDVTATFDRIGSATETCETSVVLTHGEYVVENGAYGNEQAQPPAHPITNFVQCATLTAGSAEGTVDAGWAWVWPLQTDPAERIVRATPAIVYGFKPWSPASTTTNLPALLGDVGALTIEATVDQAVGAGQNSKVVVTTWLTSSNAKAEGETVLPIVGSVNIFLNSYGSTGGGPNPVTIDGVDYDMFRSGTTLSYWRRNNQSVPITGIQLDMAKFLADGASRGVFQPTWWVAHVETAAWVTQGTGGLGLTGYKVSFQPNAE